MKRLSILFSLLIASFFLYGQQTCQLGNFHYEVIQNGDEFYFVIQQPTPDILFESFKVKINNEEFASDIVEFGPFKADCETIYTLEIQHKELDFCGITANIGTVCADISDCFIGEVTYSTSQCDSSGLAMLMIDFEHFIDSGSFVVRGNGITYGEFQYAQLPIEIGPFEADCDQKYELIIRDQQIENCQRVVEDIKICCADQCKEPVFEIVSQECSDVSLLTKLKFSENISDANITVKVNEEFVSDYQTDAQYLYLSSPLPLNAVLNTIEVCYVGIADACCFSETFITDGCGGTGGCKITDIEYSVDSCEAGDPSFIYLDFEYKDVVSDSFKVSGNNIFYGEYAYVDLPIRVGPFDSSCDRTYELVIQDSEDPNCKSVIEEIFVCCGQQCLEPIFEIVNLDCRDDEFRVKLELIHPLNSDLIMVYVNGIDSVAYSIDYPYVYVEYPFQNADIEYEITICTPFTSTDLCCYTNSFSLEQCHDEEECRIGELHLEPYDCIDAGIPGLYLDFEYANVGEEGFSLKGNGNDYGDYRYEDLPIIIQVEDNCDIFYEFVVIDNELECSSFIEYGPYCCNNACSFRAKEQRVKCQDGFLTEVAFYLEEDTDPIKSYQVFINGELLDTTEQNNQFLEFGTEIPISSNDEIILTICDSDCCVDYKLDISECLPEPELCTIENVNVKGVSCGDEGINLTLDFDHEGTNSDRFEVFSLLGSMGSFSYDELPVKIKSFPNANIGFNLLFICDQGSLCCQAHLFNTPQCFTMDGGEISNLSEEKMEINHQYLHSNPVSREIILKSPVERNEYQIFNSSGEQIIITDTMSKETLIDSSKMSPGFYLIRIENEMGIKIEKLIIAK